MLPKFGERLSQINIYKNYSYVVLVRLVTKSCLTLATPWTIAPQAPLSVGFSRQEYWSGLPCPSPGDLPNSGIESMSPALRADSLLSEPPGKHHILGYLNNRSLWSHISGEVQNQGAGRVSFCHGLWRKGLVWPLF